MRVLVAAFGLALAGCAASTVPPSGPPARSAVLTYSRMTSYIPPNGATESRHMQVAAALGDVGGEMCVVRTDGAVFDDLAALVRENRSAAPLADPPRVTGVVVPGRPDLSFSSSYRAMDGTIFRVEAEDGRALAFAERSVVRDVDGLIYALPEAEWDAARDVAHRAMLGRDCLGGST